MKRIGLLIFGVLIVSYAGAAGIYREKRQTEANPDQAAGKPGLPTSDAKQFSAESPKPVSTSHSSDVISWSGWSKFTLPPAAIFGVPAAGEDVLKEAIPPSAFPIHIKVLVHSHVDAYSELDGRLVRVRHDLEAPQVAEIRRAVARLPFAYSALTSGAIRVVPDLEVFEEVCYPGPNNQNPSLADLRIVGRINEGSYAAEDGVFRGPYFAVINVAGGTSITANGEGNFVPFYTDSTFDAQLANAVNRAVSARWKGAESNPLPEALAFGDTATGIYLKQLAAGSSPFVLKGLPPFTAPAQHTANVELSTVADSGGGTVLRYHEQDLGRHGGASLPRPPGSVTAVSFQARSTAKEPVAVRLNGKTFMLGSSRTMEPGVPFKYDGSWQTVTIPLSADGAPVTDLSITAPPDAVRIGRAALGPIDVDFRAFSTGNDGAASTVASEPMLAPANAAEMTRATASDTSDADRLNLMKSNDREVQLAAILHVPVTTNKAVLDQLLVLTNSIDARVATAATQRYAALTPPELARPELIRIIKYGLTDRVRGVAARALSAYKDPKSAGDILVLLANRTAQTRLDAAEALGNLPGKEAGIIRMAFIQQSDPAIKLAVTVTADPSDEYQMRKLLWSAVNEPSDEVRLQSGLRLIESPIASFRADGYKVVRDDSYDVRRRFVLALGDHPKEAHRDALRLAVVDSSPTVRAAAVEALAKLPQGISPEEVESLFRDEDPRVQEQLIRVVNQKKWAAPAAWVALLKKSPVDTIRAAAERLGIPNSDGQ